MQHQRPYLQALRSQVNWPCSCCICDHERSIEPLTLVQWRQNCSTVDVRVTCPRSSQVGASGPALPQVRRWDVDAGANTDTLNASKAVYCVAAPPEGAGVGLVAFGGAERVLRLWDPRTAPGEALVRPCRTE